MRGVLRVTVVALALAVMGSTAGIAHGAAQNVPTIQVLSVRADLVTGGQALTEITLPSGAKPATVNVFLNGRKVTSQFALRDNGLYEGLLTGLKLGSNTLTATLPGGRGARITITNHPIGGPVFSGPQPEPWVCEKGAVDAKCDKAPSYGWLYLPKGQTKLASYDPSDPPAASKIATTTTTTGVTVPFIVRQEIAYEDRDTVLVQTLYQQNKPWTPWDPQPQWNHKLYVMHGFDCHDTHGVTTPPTGDLAGTLSGLPVGPEDSSVEALGMGFTLMSTALDNAAVDCNPALEAESVLMAKEHVIDQFGPLKFTIGYGCSGGSLAEQWMANAYPGIYQGLIPQCAFPDAGSAAQQIFDYEALGDYFTAANGSNPLNWTPAQEAEVDGTAEYNVPALDFDATFSASAFFPFAEPSNCTDYDGYPGGDDYVPAKEIYNAQTNPDGVRCGLTDWDINLLGPDPKNTWDTQETEDGHGFANVPIDTVGVQYGLEALQKNQITPAQFADLNATVGGFNEDWGWIRTRYRANAAGLANAYRTGIINEANNLNQVAILDIMGPNDPGLAHDTFREFALKDRLQADFGTTANMAMWQGPVPLLGDVDFPDEALKAMNAWLDAVSADTSARTLPQKIIADKPASIPSQECTDGAGTMLTNALCPQAVVPVYGTPRTVAGEPQRTDVNACQLEPLNRSSYDVTFTDAEWSELETAFPDGVCDWSKPGVGQQPTVGWMTYQTKSGKVIYGGRPMPPAPASQACVVSRGKPGACVVGRHKRERA